MVSNRKEQSIKISNAVLLGLFQNENNLFCHEEIKPKLIVFHFLEWEQNENRTKVHWEIWYTKEFQEKELDSYSHISLLSTVYPTTCIIRSAQFRLRKATAFGNGKNILWPTMRPKCI